MTPANSSEESHYDSRGSLAATGRALNEILVPALESVRDDLEARGVSGGRFRIEIQHNLMENTLVLRLKAKSRLTSSLTFKHDPRQGGFQVKTVLSHPQQITTRGTTTLVAKTRSSEQTRHIAEADLTRPILEQAINNFLDGVAKANTQALAAIPNDDADLVNVGEATAPRFTTAQRERVLDAMYKVSRLADKDPQNQLPSEEQLKNNVPLDFVDWNTLVDTKSLLWQLYLHQAASDGITKRVRTPTKRRTTAKALKKELKTIPTMAIFKATYPSIIQLDDEICALLDADLQRLTAS